MNTHLQIQVPYVLTTQIFISFRQSLHCKFIMFCGKIPNESTCLGRQIVLTSIPAQIDSLPEVLGGGKEGKRWELVFVSGKSCQGSRSLCPFPWKSLVCRRPCRLSGRPTFWDGCTLPSKSCWPCRSRISSLTLKCKKLVRKGGHFTGF